MKVEGSRRKYLVTCVLVVDLLALSVGMMQSWTSPVLPKLQTASADNPLGRPITDEESSWIGSILGVGSVAGPFAFSPAAEKFGRKPVLILIALLATLANLMLAFGGHILVYYAARIVVGFASLGMFQIVAIYVVELSEDSVRGTLAGSINIYLVAGQLVAYSIGPYLSVTSFTLSCTVPAVLYVVLSWRFAPETPQYYLSRGNAGAAKKALEMVRQDGAEEELEEMHELLKSSSKGGLGDVWRGRGNLKALGITVALMTFQQFSGIFPILAYMQSIFEAANTSLTPEVSTIVIAAVQFAASFVTPVVVDRYGRRPLLLFSCLGVLISEAILGGYFYLDDPQRASVSWLPIACLVVYMATYVFGLGPLPWIVMAELLPSDVRPVASSIACSVLCFEAFLMAKFFGNLVNFVGLSGTFWFFSCCNFAALVFTALAVPETKGKSARQIQEMLQPSDGDGAAVRKYVFE